MPCTRCAITFPILFLRWTCNWLWCLLLFAGPATAAGPPARAFVQQFGATEGFNQPFAYCLLQDHQNYLWIGTAEGVVRYDGTRFQTFTTHDGLAENFVTGMWENPVTGELWLTHYQGGRSLRTAPGQPFRPMLASAMGGPPPAAPGIAPPDTAALQAYRRRFPHALPADVVLHCLLTDRQGNTWLGTAGQGLWRHSDNYLSLLPPAGPGQPVLLARPGPAWVSWGSWPLLALPSATGAASGPAAPRLPGGQPVQALLARPDGGVWLASGNQLWSAAGPAQVAQPVAAFNQLATSSITALAYAPGSGLWVGTAADGVYLLPQEAAAGATQGAAMRQFTTANGLLHNTVYALLADHTGRVWIASHNTGLGYWNPARQQFAYTRPRAHGVNVNALAETADGTLWVGTEGQGLYFRPAKSSGWQHLSTAQGLVADYFVGLLPLPGTAAQPAGRLLLVHPQGLSMLDPTTRTAATLAAATDPLVRDCLPSVALASGPPALVWVATRAGLLRLDLRLLAERPAAATLAPKLVFTGAEVDGESRPVALLGELPARNHRVSFAFQGIMLLANSLGGLEYRYRLRGLSDDWSHPSAAGEAQFVGLGPGRYTLEAQVRRAGPGAVWSAAVRNSFGIATPWWRQAWALVLGAVLLLGGGWGFVHTRERVLRGQKLQLENTVRDRTSELRRQKGHIEEMNRDLLVARDAAEASRRAKAQFLANMSHEIRTPMNAVIGLTNLLRHTQPTDEQSEFLTAISSSSQNLLVILNDILDSSKMEAGKLTLERIAFRLPDMVRGLNTMFRYAADSKGLNLRTEIGSQVPEAVLGDPVRLQQVLVNLVSNALKFTQRGGVTVRLALVPGEETPAGHVALRFVVQDTGIGIAADKLTTIFEDFSQANTSTTREFGGTGLGLSIARNLVGLHGGQLGVRSELGTGSEFFFDLTYPVAEEQAARPTAVMSRLAPFEPALRVLVAEDNHLNQLVARKTLKNWNVEVEVADNGRLAVAQVLAANPPFDAVLMDIQMPELDGYAATTELRRHFPDQQALPIIGLTASVLPEDRNLALQVGMNDILAKPFEPAMLYTRLAYFTGRQADLDDVPAPAPAPAATTLHPNWQQLEELAGGNESFVAQIVGTFLTEAPALEQLLVAALPTDHAALAQVAHKLKGQVAYFGVPLLHAQLDELERSATQPNCPYCAQLVQSVQQQLGRLYPQLQERA